MVGPQSSHSSFYDAGGELAGDNLSFRLHGLQAMNRCNGWVVTGLLDALMPTAQGFFLQFWSFKNNILEMIP
jgi:hypothetical protein